MRSHFRPGRGATARTHLEQGVPRGRLEKIQQWQTEINLSVMPLSAGEETLPQVRRLMGSLAPQRRVR